MHTTGFLACTVFLLHLSVIVRGYSGVQTINTDVATARRVVESTRVTIWEPTPPTSEYFVLGQHFHTKRERPRSDTELIVGRSEDGSLAEPLDFYGKWAIAENVIVWTMHCPDGFVSLGAIATRKNMKPDATKYRCVKIEETYAAQMWSTIHENEECQLMTIYSESGWRNCFFVVRYSKSKIATNAYTLKKDPVSQSDVSRISRKNTPPKNNNVNNSAPSPEESRKNPKNADTGLQSYTVLIISAAFVLFIIIVFVTLLCFKNNRTKRGEQLTITSTGITALDSGLPSNGSVSGSDTSMSGSGGVRGRLMHVELDANNGSQRQRHNESVTRYDEVFQPQSEEFEVKENILYHNVQCPLIVENEYQTISNMDAQCDRPEGQPQVLNETAEPYSFAV